MRILLCPMSDAGYLYPAIAVGRCLADRGHQVVTVGNELAAPHAAAADLALIAADAQLQSGFRVRHWHRDALLQYRAVRNAVVETAADVLVTSTLCHGALLAAEVTDIPAVVIGFAAHIWSYRCGAEDEPQPAEGSREWRTQETVRHYQSVREQVGLTARQHRYPDQPLYGAALLLRGDPALEYPGASLPAEITHIGPCNWEPAARREEVDALINSSRHAGDSLAYVHLGRTFGGSSMWPQLNAAFAGTGIRAIVELGRTGQPSVREGADIQLVRKPWMAELVRAADVVLCSGTSSPTLMAIEHAKPLMMAPAGSEQPLLAQACVRAGVGQRLPPAGEAAALRALSANRTVRAQAAKLGARLRRRNGAQLAANVIESIASCDPGQATTTRITGRAG